MNAFAFRGNPITKFTAIILSLQMAFFAIPVVPAYASSSYDQNILEDELLYLGEAIVTTSFDTLNLVDPENQTADSISYMIDDSSVLKVSTTTDGDGTTSTTTTTNPVISKYVSLASSYESQTATYIQFITQTDTYSDPWVAFMGKTKLANENAGYSNGDFVATFYASIGYDGRGEYEIVDSLGNSNYISVDRWYGKLPLSDISYYNEKGIGTLLVNFGTEVKMLNVMHVESETATQTATMTGMDLIAAVDDGTLSDTSIIDDREAGRRAGLKDAELGEYLDEGLYSPEYTNAYYEAYFLYESYPTTNPATGTFTTKMFGVETPEGGEVQVSITEDAGSYTAEVSHEGSTVMADVEYDGTYFNISAYINDFLVEVQFYVYENGIETLIILFQTYVIGLDGWIQTYYGPDGFPTIINRSAIDTEVTSLTEITTMGDTETVTITNIVIITDTMPGGDTGDTTLTAADAVAAVAAVIKIAIAGGKDVFGELVVFFTGLVDSDDTAYKAAAYEAAKLAGHGSFGFGAYIAAQFSDFNASTFIDFVRETFDIANRETLGESAINKLIEELIEEMGITIPPGIQDVIACLKGDGPCSVFSVPFQDFTKRNLDLVTKIENIVEKEGMWVVDQDLSDGRLRLKFFTSGLPAVVIESDALLSNAKRLMAVHNHLTGTTEGSIENPIDPMMGFNEGGIITTSAADQLKAVGVESYLVTINGAVRFYDDSVYNEVVTTDRIVAAVRDLFERYGATGDTATATMSITDIAVVTQTETDSAIVMTTVTNTGTDLGTVTLVASSSDVNEDGYVNRIDVDLWLALAPTLLRRPDMAEFMAFLVMDSNEDFRLDFSDEITPTLEAVDAFLGDGDVRSRPVRLYEQHEAWDVTSDGDISDADYSAFLEVAALYPDSGQPAVISDLILPDYSDDSFTFTGRLHRYDPVQYRLILNRPCSDEALCVEGRMDVDISDFVEGTTERPTFTYTHRGLVFGEWGRFGVLLSGESYTVQIVDRFAAPVIPVGRVVNFVIPEPTAEDLLPVDARFEDVSYTGSTNYFRIQGQFFTDQEDFDVLDYGIGIYVSWALADNPATQLGSGFPKNPATELGAGFKGSLWDLSDFGLGNTFNYSGWWSSERNLPPGDYIFTVKAWDRARDQFIAVSNVDVTIPVFEPRVIINNIDVDRDTGVATLTVKLSSFYFFGHALVLDSPGDSPPLHIRNTYEPTDLGEPFTLYLGQTWFNELEEPFTLTLPDLVPDEPYILKIVAYDPRLYDDIIPEDVDLTPIGEFATFTISESGGVIEPPVIDGTNHPLLVVPEVVVENIEINYDRKRVTITGTLNDYKGPDFGHRLNLNWAAGADCLYVHVDCTDGRDNVDISRYVDLTSQPPTFTFVWVILDSDDPAFGDDIFIEVVDYQRDIPVVVSAVSFVIPAPPAVEPVPKFKLNYVSSNYDSDPVRRSVGVSVDIENFDYETYALVLVRPNASPGFSPLVPLTRPGYTEPGPTRVGVTLPGFAYDEEYIIKLVDYDASLYGLALPDVNLFPALGEFITFTIPAPASTPLEVKNFSLSIDTVSEEVTVNGFIPGFERDTHAAFIEVEMNGEKIKEPVRITADIPADYFSLGSGHFYDFIFRLPRKNDPSDDSYLLPDGVPDGANIDFKLVVIALDDVAAYEAGTEVDTVANPVELTVEYIERERIVTLGPDAIEVVEIHAPLPVPGNGSFENVTVKTDVRDVTLTGRIIGVPEPFDLARYRLDILSGGSEGPRSPGAAKVNSIGNFSWKGHMDEGLNPITMRLWDEVNREYIGEYLGITVEIPALDTGLTSVGTTRNYWNDTAEMEVLLKDFDYHMHDLVLVRPGGRSTLTVLPDPMNISTPSPNSAERSFTWLENALIFDAPYRFEIRMKDGSIVDQTSFVLSAPPAGTPLPEALVTITDVTPERYARTLTISGKVSVFTQPPDLEKLFMNIEATDPLGTIYRFGGRFDELYNNFFWQVDPAGNFTAEISLRYQSLYNINIRIGHKDWPNSIGEFPGILEVDMPPLRSAVAITDPIDFRYDSETGEVYAEIKASLVDFSTLDFEHSLVLDRPCSGSAFCVDGRIKETLYTPVRDGDAGIIDWDTRPPTVTFRIYDSAYGGFAFGQPYTLYISQLKYDGRPIRIGGYAPFRLTEPDEILIGTGVDEPAVNLGGISVHSDLGRDGYVADISGELIDVNTSVTPRDHRLILQRPGGTLRDVSSSVNYDTVPPTFTLTEPNLVYGELYTLYISGTESLIRIGEVATFTLTEPASDLFSAHFVDVSQGATVRDVNIAGQVVGNTVEFDFSKHRMHVGYGRSRDEAEMNFGNGTPGYFNAEYDSPSSPWRTDSEGNFSWTEHMDFGPGAYDITVIMRVWDEVNQKYIGENITTLNMPALKPRVILTGELQINHLNYLQDEVRVTGVAEDFDVETHALILERPGQEPLVVLNRSNTVIWLSPIAEQTPFVVYVPDLVFDEPYEFWIVMKDDYLNRVGGSATFVIPAPPVVEDSTLRVDSFTLNADSITGVVTYSGATSGFISGEYEAYIEVHSLGGKRRMKSVKLTIEADGSFSGTFKLPATLLPLDTAIIFTLVFIADVYVAEYEASDSSISPVPYVIDTIEITRQPIA